jgi:hypothetical protein
LRKHKRLQDFGTHIPVRGVVSQKTGVFRDTLLSEALVSFHIQFAVVTNCHLLWRKSHFGLKYDQLGINNLLDVRLLQKTED